MKISKNHVGISVSVVMLLGIMFIGSCSVADKQSYPLPSWNDGGTKTAIVEFAYAEKDSASLKAAKAGGWQVVSMKNDWKLIFPKK